MKTQRKESLQVKLEAETVSAEKISKILRDLWDDPKYKDVYQTLRSSNDYIKYFKDVYNWDIDSNLLDDAWDLASEDAEDEDESITINGETFYDRSDANRWLNSKLNEYGNTHFFPSEDRKTLNKLIDKFGNTYFWRNESLEVKTEWYDPNKCANCGKELKDKEGYVILGQRYCDECGPDEEDKLMQQEEDRFNYEQDIENYFGDNYNESLIVKEDKNEENKMIITVESGISADGFDIIIKNGNDELFKKSYRYGYDASYSREHAESAKRDHDLAIKNNWEYADLYYNLRPYTQDIIEDLMKKYHVSKNNIIVTNGKNVFAGEPVSDKNTNKFINNYIKPINESKEVPYDNTTKKKCPRCGQIYTQYPALSRRDNKTYICPDCGTEEAMEDYFNAMRRHKDESRDRVAETIGKFIYNLGDDAWSYGGESKTFKGYKIYKLYKNGKAEISNDEIIDKVLEEYPELELVAGWRTDGDLISFRTKEIIEESLIVKEDEDEDKMYVCMDCGGEFESFQVLVKDPYGNPSCPYCGSGDVSCEDDDDNLLEAYGLSLTDMRVEDGMLKVKINGKEYGYQHDVLTPEELKDKFDSIAKHSEGKAFAWLKAHSKLVSGGKKKEESLELLKESVENSSIFSMIKDKFEEIKKEKNISNDVLLDNGAIYYMNGNDGTDFDWQANGRTCEFMVFYKETERGMAKLSVFTDGSIEGYFWSDLGNGEGQEIKAGKISEEDAQLFVASLYKQTDDKSIYDKKITGVEDNDGDVWYYWIDSNEDEDDEWEDYDPYEDEEDEEDLDESLKIKTENKNIKLEHNEGNTVEIYHFNNRLNEVRDMIDKAFDNGNQVLMEKYLSLVSTMLNKYTNKEEE